MAYPLPFFCLFVRSPFGCSISFRKNIFIAYTRLALFTFVLPLFCSPALHLLVTLLGHSCLLPLTLWFWLRLRAPPLPFPSLPIFYHIASQCPI
ncbi:hypothetical protein FA13DRAFT_208051 [Coprinellus micaceus]|uniref:Uncharacterized protein n=1 Tax=Coprinellus micaceus TaxID=71717 RepID=A0A4Y7SG54_COPMI|nr:hypothetical protein FA13DRAFT_208051 [Coprinellus micaceus]